MLQLAKWPYLLLALYHVLVRRTDYTVTRKDGGKPRRRGLLWPHLVVAGVLVMAGGIGMALARPLDPIVVAWGAFTVAVSLGLVLTEHLSWPPSYDAELQRASLGF